MPRQQMYIAIALAALLASTLGTALWSTHRIHSLEHEVETARQAADTLTRRADESEKAAEAYKAKIEYLGTQLAEINQLAKEQDEQIQKLDIETRNVRGRVDAARRIRSIATTADELCKNLADAGHGCETRDE